MTRQRGQVLIIAVLVLFAVASVAALLAAIVGAQIIQVSRYTDVSELREAAESILRLANEQLSYGWQGADWRPPKESYQVGKAVVGITVNYGPVPPPIGDVQDRYLRISVAARFPDDPFLRYSVLAFKPLLLTDYARFITDRYELRQSAALGAGGVELGGAPRPDSIEAGDYEFTISGPIRSNTDLEWHGRSRVNLVTLNDTDWSNLGLFRDDRIEVAGVMRPALRPGQPDLGGKGEASIDASPLALSVDGTVRTANVFDPNTVLEQSLYTAGFADETFAGSPTVTNTWRVLADLPRYQAVFPADKERPELSASLSVPRVQPPRFDAAHPEMHTNRYLILTRDSGKWVRVGTSALVNAGAYGYGWANYGGIYLDNFEDIQYNHDLEKLRLNWMGGYRAAADGRSGNVELPPADWWDRTGRHYAPPGVEIVLHGEAACPYIEVTRHTLRATPDVGQTKGTLYYWCDHLGKPIQVGSVAKKYPDDFPEIASSTEGACPLSSATALKPEVHDETAIFPFPPNGVIYAEGNVRIRGVMPQNGNFATPLPTKYFDKLSPFNAANLPAAPARDRCYDLQVVSGGTIYIEGDLLSATAARTYSVHGVTSDADIAAYDRDRAARLALIARDDVCVNTTALLPRPANLYGENGTINKYNDGQPVYPGPSTQGYPPYMFFRGVEKDANDPSLGSDLKPPLPTEPLTAKGEPASAQFVYSSVRLQSLQLKGLLPELRLIMGHSGWFVMDPKTDGPAIMPLDVDPNRQAQVIVQRFLNDMTPANFWPWSEEQQWYTFRVPGVGSPTKDASEHWYLENDGNRTPPFDDNGNAVCDYAEFLPNDKPQTMVLDPARVTETPQQRLKFEPWVVPVREVVDPGPPPVYVWKVDPHQLGYVLGPVAVAPLRDKDPLPVEIDALVYAQNGSWFILPGPWFNEDPDEVYESEPGGLYPAYHEPLNIALRFYGAISENMPAPIGDVTDWTSKWAGPYGARAGFLTYTYDPVLRWYRGPDAMRPVFPNFLLTPDLIVWGERVAGASGAGT